MGRFMGNQRLYAEIYEMNRFNDVIDASDLESGESRSELDTMKSWIICVKGHTVL